eukprot:1365663-Amphidinium_carterae.2
MALDPRPERAQRQARDLVIKKLKKETVFDKCVLDELSRLETLQAIKSIATKEESIALLLDSVTIRHCQHIARHSTQKMLNQWWGQLLENLLRHFAHC